jgi:hypothetical protein
MRHQEDAAAVVGAIIRELGGNEVARKVLDDEHNAFLRLWHRPDLDAVGRVLRAHLFVEHHMGSALRAANPRLGNLGDARLTFLQKVSLLDRTSKGIVDILPAIRYLNAMRNRMAHDLKASLRPQDAQRLQSSPIYTAFRNASGRAKTTDPLVAVEEVAQYAAVMLQGGLSALSRAVAAAVGTPRPELGDPT